MVMVPKPGQTPPLRSEPGFNESNPLYPAILATVLLCSILTTFSTAARLITKRLVSTYDLEDYVLLMAWVISIALEFGLLAAGMAGLGHHVWHLREAQYVRLDQYSWALELLYFPAIWLAKASLLFQMMRIFTPLKSGPVYWACHALIWGNLAFYFSVFLSTLFECRPIWGIWNPIHEGHCNHRNVLPVVASAINMSSDLLNLLLPLWATWHLQMIPQKKAGITAIFMTGLFAFISSICRLVYATHIISSPDFSYITAQTALWGLAEIATVILCTCLPMMPQCLTLVTDHYRSHYPKTSSSSPSSPSYKMNVRGLRIVKVGTAQSSTGIGGGIRGTGGGLPLVSQEQDKAWRESPYERLGDEGNEAVEAEDVVRDLGRKRKVEVEMASWDQLNARSRHASMV